MKQRCLLLTFVFATCFTLNTLISIAQPGVTEPRRKGVQLVLLPYWSLTSVNNFLATFKDSEGRCTKGPKEIEIAFVPYRIVSGSPKPPTNYQNVRRIINCLRGGGKTVFVTVHLSFHASGTSKDTAIGDNAKDFNDNFLRQYYNRAVVAVCPSLEDQGSASDFNRWAGIVASKIDSNIISRVSLRRSDDPRHSNSNTLPSSLCFKGKCFRSRQAENHGKINNSGFAYSNDGNFVYYPIGSETEESISTVCADNPSPQYPLYSIYGPNGEELRRGFIEHGVRSLRNTMLLWRPAYNLLTKNWDGAKWVYSRCNRDFSDGRGAFDATEQNVLKLFLGIP